MAGEALGEAIRQPAKPGKATSAKVFECPSCGGSVTIRAQGQTLSAVCTSCGSIIDTSNENYQILSKVSKRLKVEPLIPLGQRGKVHGVLWEVIGFMQCSDPSEFYRWGEYLLFNPARGFRWLSEFDGHWNYITPVRQKLSAEATSDLLGGNRTAVTYLGRPFHLFHMGKSKVNYVVGEFYWRVKAGETVEVRDYVSPPEVLTREQSSDEINWSVGEYVEPGVIEAAFQIKRRLPAPTGVAPNQPSTLSSLMPSIGRSWLYFFGFLFAVQLIFASMLAHNEEVYSGNFQWRHDDPQNSVVTPQFELKHGVSNVAFRMTSWVQNNWLELSIDLVNDKDGTVFSLEQGVEFYSGRDSDGSWSEGNQSSEKILSSVPDGLYHLNIQATGPVSSAWNTTPLQEQNYYISVVRDVPTWSNFFLALLTLSLLPAIVWWRGLSFERQRWSTSDFSPYWMRAMESED